MNANPLKVEASEVTTKREAMALLKAMANVRAGEDGEPEYITEDEAIIRYARRALALFKDQARVKAGKVATVYTPRVLEPLPAKVRKAALALVDTLPETPEPAKASKPTPKAKPSKPAPAKASKPALGKASKPAPKAAKVAKVAPAADTGGAAVEF